MDVRRGVQLGERRHYRRGGRRVSRGQCGRDLAHHRGNARLQRARRVLQGGIARPARVRGGARRLGGRPELVLHRPRLGELPRRGVVARDADGQLAPLGQHAVRISAMDTRSSTGSTSRAIPSSSRPEFSCRSERRARSSAPPAAVSPQGLSTRSSRRSRLRGGALCSNPSRPERPSTSWRCRDAAIGHSTRFHSRPHRDTRARSLRR